MSATKILPLCNAMPTELIRVIVICGLVAACGGTPPGGTGASDQAATVISSSDDLSATNTPPAESPAEARLPAPADLIGETRDGVTGLLGDPVFVRRDPPAEFWRYRHKTCVLELFFYERGGAHRLDHMTTRRTDSIAAKDSEQARCLQALIATRTPS